jgi:hypothetical protein
MKQAVATVEPMAPEVVSPGQQLTPFQMLDRAVMAGATPETLEKLMTLQERFEKSEARRAFDAAIAEAKAEIKPVVRNKAGHNAKRYADFAAIARMVDPVLSKFGLSYRFRSEQGDKINVTCILSHKLGHSEETTLSGPADTSGNKNAIQAIGSTLTYLQRYSLMQAVGLAAADDDDAQAAGAGETVTDAQAEDIKQTIVRIGMDIQKFLKAFKIETVEGLPAKRYQEAKDRLAAFADTNKKPA